MKNLKKLVITGAVVLTALTVMVPKTYASNNVQVSLQEEYDGEIYAKKMYEQLVEKFDNDSYYSKLVNAETNHARVVARAMSKLGYNLEEKEVEVKTSDDELTALKEALKYEQDDVAAYENKIKNAENEIEKAVYERLREGSKRHATSLELAIKDYEKNGVINHKQNGENKSSNRNENCQGNCIEGNRGQNKGVNRNENCNKGFGLNSQDERPRQLKRLNSYEKTNLNCTGDCPQEMNRQNRSK